MNEQLVWPVDRIVVQDRFRKDLGELDGLASSLAEIGFLHPIVVRPDGRLVAGARRLAACRDILGLSEVPVRIIDIAALVRGEADENALRLDLAPEEALDIFAAVVEEEKALAKQRMLVGKKADPPANGRRVNGDSRDAAAARTGYSATSLKRAETVVAAAKADPVTFGPVRDEMNRSHNIDRALSTVRRVERERKLLRQRQPGFGSVSLVQADAIEFLQDLAPSSIDLLLTDPPYMTDVEDIWVFADEWISAALPILKPTGRFYIFTGAYPDELNAYTASIAERLPDGWTLDNILVWTYRNTMGPSPTHGYKLNWQACFYGYGPDAPPLDCPSLNEQFTVQDINAPDARNDVRLHAWEKPKELAVRLLSHSTTAGQTVVDPFAGTGSFVAAAEELGRHVFACENNPEMLALCAKRGLGISA